MVGGWSSYSFPVPILPIYLVNIRTRSSIPRERIKEELKDETNNILAFDGGYTKSRTAIIDANITTLLAAVILFFMGSGPVKGFAVTLGVGIFTTLFSVYFIARLLTSLYVTKNKNNGKLI